MYVKILLNKISVEKCKLPQHSIPNQTKQCHCRDIVKIGTKLGKETKSNFSVYNDTQSYQHMHKKIILVTQIPYSVGKPI